jgi:energy-coupling factor transporter ATP-binding protein EcfA2
VLLKTQALSYEYEGGIRALRGVDLTICEGETVALVGRNGSGKSTLAMLTAGLYRPTRGEITLRGREPHRVAPLELARTVGLVFQDPDHQIFTEKIEDEVEFGLKNAGVPEQQRRKAVQDALKAVGIFDRRREDPFSQPRGIRQLTTIAAALAMDPDLLVLDEPITGLDSCEIDRLIGLLRKLNRQGKTIVIITHSMELAARCSDRMVVMSDGQIALDTPTREAFGDEAALLNLGLAVPKVARLGAMLGGLFVTRDEALAALERARQ